MKTLIFILITVFTINAWASAPNCKIVNQNDYAVTTVSTIRLAANATRKCLWVKNHASSSVLHIKFGSAHTGTEGLTIPAATIWEPITPPTSSLYFKAPAGTYSTTIIEGF